MRRKLGKKPDVDAPTLAKLERLVSFAQARNDELKVELEVWQERAAVLEAKMAIVAAELAASREAVNFLKFRAGGEPEGRCEGCAWAGAVTVDMVTGEVYRGCCLRWHE